MPTQDFTQTAPALSPVQQCEAATALLGDHPEDVLSPMKNAAEALCWVEEILLIIKQDAKDAKRCARNATRIHRLADAAAYLASEFSNYAGAQHELYIGRLHDAGLVNSAAVNGGEA